MQNYSEAKTNKPSTTIIHANSTPQKNIEYVNTYKFREDFQSLLHALKKNKKFQEKPGKADRYDIEKITGSIFTAKENISKLEIELNTKEAEIPKLNERQINKTIKRENQREKKLCTLESQKRKLLSLTKNEQNEIKILFLNNEEDRLKALSLE